MSYNSFISINHRIYKSTNFITTYNYKLLLTESTLIANSFESDTISLL